MTRSCFFPGSSLIGLASSVSMCAAATKEIRLFDSHCHLDDRYYRGKMEDILQHMEEAGVKAAMTVGIDLESSKKGVALAQKYPCLIASSGVHPHLAKDCTEDTIKTLSVLSKSPCVRAWGETGLDFNRMFSPQKDQEKWFVRQVETADELGLPLIFHERDTNGRFLEILKHHTNPSRKGVVHCFSGTKEEMFACLDLGYHIGITGIVTIEKRGKLLRSLVPHIPKERILIETDAPFLTPAPEKNRFRKNEPAFVKSTFSVLCRVLNADPGELSATLWENTTGFFGAEFS